MKDFRNLLSQVATDLDELEARWVLIGGLAVGARTVPRFTQDLDVAVAVSEDNEAELLVRGFLRRVYRDRRGSRGLR